jgi:phage recombination protein Bet
MAGSAVVTKDDLKMAVTQYASKNELTVSENENGFALMPGDIIVTLENGKPKCGNTEVWEGVCNILVDSRSEPARATQTNNLPARPMNTRSNGRSSNGGPLAKAGLAVRDIQVAELTFEDIKTYICPAATDQETMMFLKLCQARNLNPFLKEAYLIKYDGGKPAQMVVGKDKFTKTAEEHPQFDGFKAGIIVGAGDEILEREGTFYRKGKGEELLGGWAEIYRKDRKMPFKQTVSLQEFDKGMANWKTMPGTMIRKCALVQALRECFATDLAGCYDSAEMDQSIDADFEVGA